MHPRLHKFAASALALAGFATLATAQRALQLVNSSAASGYVRIPDSPALRPQQFTIELFVKTIGIGYGFTNDAVGAALIAKPVEGAVGSHLSSWLITWVPSTGKIGVLMAHQIGSQGVALFSNTSLPLGTNAHVAVSFDGTTIRLYINGQLDSSMAFGFSGIDYTANDVLIGACNFGAGYYRRCTALIDDVRIWDHARDATAIELLSSCRLTGDEAGLIAYYTFNGSSAFDATGHAHAGAFVGTSYSFVAEPVAITPCGSPSQSYCTAGTSSHGCTATMSASGLASVSRTSGYVLTTSNVEAQKFGLLFYGINGPNAVPWAAGSSSVLCVKLPLQRTSASSSGGATGTCNGSFALDFLAYLAANPGSLGAPFSGGELIRAQTWYRDPPAPGTTNLSNAISFVTTP
jgi:hypothetical protein